MQGIRECAKEVKCAYIRYLKKEMQQMEWNWSSSVVEIPLDRFILVYYQVEQPYKNAPKNLGSIFVPLHLLQFFFMYRICIPRGRVGEVCVYIYICIQSQES